MRVMIALFMAVSAASFGFSIRKDSDKQPQGLNEKRIDEFPKEWGFWANKEAVREYKKLDEEIRKIGEQGREDGEKYSERTELLAEELMHAPIGNGRATELWTEARRERMWEIREERLVAELQFLRQEREIRRQQNQLKAKFDR